MCIPMFPKKPENAFSEVDEVILQSLKKYNQFQIFSTLKLKQKEKFWNQPLYVDTKRRCV